MSKIGKNSTQEGNFHLKALPSEGIFKHTSTKNPSPVKNLWLQNIDFGVKAKRLEPLKKKSFEVNEMEPKGKVGTVAFKVLFPSLVGPKKFDAMPENTLEEKIAKEQFFRGMLLEQFDMREVMSDSNCGLRAVISSLNPELDKNSEDITAVILRGDLVEFVMKHPQFIEGGTQPEVLKSYCNELSKCNGTLGINELRIMSEILENPIHIYRYEDAQIDESNKITSGPESSFGDNYTTKKPISIYYDPLNSQYFPLYPKRTSKFGILKQ